MTKAAATVLTLILMTAGSGASAQSLESLKAGGIRFDASAVLKASQSFAKTRQAPGRALAADAAAQALVEPACYNRDAQEIADRLRMPARFCLDFVAAEGNSLIVRGSPISGNFRLSDGEAAVFHTEEGSACSEGESATIFVSPDGKVRAETGNTPDVCHSSWQYEELTLRRVPAASGAISLDIPGGLDFECTIRDHGGRGCPIDAKLRHDAAGADVLKVTNLMIGESVSISQAKAGALHVFALRHVQDDQTDKGLPLASGKNRVLVEALKGGRPAARKFFDLEASFRWAY